MAKRRNPDEDIRQLEKAFEGGDQEAGLKLISALIKSGKLELDHFPTALLNKSSDLKQLLKQTYNRQGDSLVTICGVKLVTVINQVHEIIEEFVEAHGTDTPEQSVSAFFNKYLNNFENSESCVESELGLFEDSEYTTSEETDHSILVAYRDIATEECVSNIFVMLASQYRTEYTNITIENYRNLPDPVGLLRYFRFRLTSSGELILVSFKIREHSQGLWQDDTEALQRHLSAIREPVVLLNEIELPFTGPPRLLTGSCEDRPCCGHDICPPRWSHTGEQAAAVCAICGDYVDSGSRYSSHESCLRRSVEAEDGYYDDYYDEDEEEEDEEDDENDEDDDYHNDAFYEWEHDPEPDYDY